MSVAKFGLKNSVLHVTMDFNLTSLIMISDEQPSGLLLFMCSCSIPQIIFIRNAEDIALAREPTNNTSISATEAFRHFYKRPLTLTLCPPSIVVLRMGSDKLLSKFLEISPVGELSGTPPNRLQLLGGIIEKHRMLGSAAWLLWQLRRIIDMGYTNCAREDFSHFLTTNPSVPWIKSNTNVHARTVLTKATGWCLRRYCTTIYAMGVLRVFVR
jgi:hypothetical protein